MPLAQQPIAVFDSGLGGLTVVRALRQRLPHHALIYFGDTARVPYGTKSASAVTRFTGEIVRFLSRFDPSCIVAACNTASAVAVPVVAREIDVPLVSVVLPGARDGASACRDGDVVAVIGTTATVSSNAYRNAINRLNPRLAVVQKACPLLVPLVEEGRRPDDAVIRLCLSEYLEPVRRLRPRAVVLGCTHYPMLKTPIGDFLGEQTRLIDSADATARYVEELLAAGRSLSEDRDPGRLLCYVSDNPQQFQFLGSRMLGEPITDVARVCPEEFASATMPA
ncbi:MAG: glutamate racemase, partial [bacterium]|nr:glutamate racemase [bacterium]